MDQSPLRNGLHRKENIQDILLKISQNIIETLDYDRVLQVISDGMAELLDIETAAIYLLDDEHLYLGATTPPLDPGMPDELRKARLADHLHIKKAVETRGSVYMPDAEKANLTPAERAIVEMRKLRTNLYFPFVQKNEVLGVLIMSTSSKSRDFSEEERNLGQTVANQLSISIKNAALHAQLISNNQKLSEEIRERARIQRALTKSEAHLSNALRMGKLGHWEYDAKDNLFTFTDEFFAMLRTSAGENGGYSMSPESYSEKYVHPEDRHMVTMAIRNLLQASDPGFTGYYEHRILYRDGTAGDVAVRCRVVMDKAGNVKGSLGVNQDISDRKKAEEEILKAKEKAEESDRLKSAFLANLSHEIRTPMNAIVGFTCLLKNNNLSEHDREKYAEMVQQGSTRLLELISEIVDISKLDAGMVSVKNDHFDLNSLLDDLQLQYANSLDNKPVKITISAELPEGESIVFSDPGRLNQVLSNLVENAIRFTEEGTIEIGYEVVGDMLRFHVKDTGRGIDPKDHDMIFERFWQADNHGGGLKSGTGLGLSIVKSLVNLMKGEVWVESRSNEGAVFYFTIPFVRSRGKKHDVKMDTKLPGKHKMNILIAEDELLNFRYLEALFKADDHQIHHASNGREALELFSKYSDIDFVLMDIKMPELDGIEATRQIRILNKTIPVIALSAYTLANEKKEALEAGCNDFLSKPCTREILFETISKYVS